MAMIAVQTASAHGDDESIARLRAALDVQDALDPADPGTACAVALPLARAYARSGRAEDALSVLDSRATRGSIDRFHAPILHADRAACLRIMGRLTEALDALARAESALRDQEPKDSIEFHRVTRCEILGERGQVFLDLGRPDLAAPNFELEHELAQHIDDPTPRFAALLHSIHLDLARERDASAIARIDAALVEPWISALGQGALAMLEARRALAFVRWSIDDPSQRDGARDATRRALAHASDDGLLGLDDRVAVSLAAARIERIAGDFDAALRHLDRAKEWVEREGGGGSSSLRGSCAAAETALAIARFDPDSRDPLVAARDRVESIVLAMLAEWDAAPPLESGLGFFHFHSRCELVVETIRAIATLDPSERGARDAFEWLLRVDARSSVSAGETATIDGLREHVLGDDDLLLAWLPSVETTALFVVSQDEVRYFECAGISNLAAVGEAVRDELEMNPESHAAARRLFDRLVPEAIRARVAESPRLLLYGLEIIGSVPFEAAVNAKGERVGIAHGVTRLTSLGGSVRRGANRDERRAWRSVHVLAPTLGAALRAQRPDLELLTPEHANVGEFATLGGVDLVGSSATVAALTRALAIPTHGLSILTHGALDPSSARPGRLVFAPEHEGDIGWLDCAGAESLPPCDFVFLAACRSGVGPLRRGDAGAADLAGAFLLAGARVVVATTDDVRAGHAARLAILTERGVRSGETPCEALSSARRALIAEGPESERADRIRAAWSFRMTGLGNQVVEFDR